MIETPKAGDALKASWAAQVAEAVNGAASMGAAGLLARDGIAGRGFATLPVNRRERRAAAAAETAPAPFQARATVERKTDETDGAAKKRLKVELYSLSSGLVRVNATFADWSEDDSGFGAADGWVTVFEGEWVAADAASLGAAQDFSVEIKLFTTVDDTFVKKVASQTAACRIVTGAVSGADGWSVSDGVATLTATVPVAKVSAAGEVTAQHHEGVVLFYAPVPHLKCGDDSNIVFTLGADGAISADVYYK